MTVMGKEDGVLTEDGIGSVVEICAPIIIE
jgi:hypothetical protein